MKRQVLNILVLFLLPFASYSQEVWCGVDAKTEENNAYYERLNQEIQAIISAKNLRRSAVEEKLRIPVVVHIIHNNNSGVIGGEGNPNLSDERVFSQIRILNEDFGKKPGTPGYNEHPAGADMGIEFFLATIDPDGAPTTGITRTYSSRRSFSVYTDLELLSSLAYWDSSKYLNIWVTRFSGGIIGYASMPMADFPGLDIRGESEYTDGIFVDHSVFGPNPNDEIYAMGRTTTHEVGHWLGLIHTWGDRRCGTDYCDDTPTIEFANLGNSCDDIFSYCDGVEVRNMIENYMDYSPDRCMNIFTRDQKNRARAIVQLSERRRKLLENAVIFNPIEEPLLVNILGNPVENHLIEIRVFVNQPKDYELLLADNWGRILYRNTFQNSMSRTIQIPSDKISKGVLNLRVHAGSDTVFKRLVVL